MPFPITSDEIERAYAETGLRPSDSEWINVRCDAACALGVVVALRHGLARLSRVDEQYNQPADVGRLLGLRPNEVRDFTIGFGGDPAPRHGCFDAFAAGRAARERFIPSEEG